MKRFGIKMQPMKITDVEDPHLTKICGVCREELPFSLFLGSTNDFRVRNVCIDCLKNRPAESRQFFAAIRPQALAKYARARLMTRHIYGYLKEEYNNNKKEVNKMSVKQQARNYYNLPDKIANIIGKTYSVRGDDPKTIPDDEAIMRIRDLLDELDPTLIERNKNKRLSR